MMVGLIIFTIGVLGLSGMLVMQTKVNRSAKGIDESSTLMQSMIEDLNNVTFVNLGNDSAWPYTNGRTAGDVATRGPLDKLGFELTGGVGPYIYYRSVVICQKDFNLPNGSSPTYCGGSLSGNNRPSELACPFSLSLSNREKLVRVLVGWTDRDGKCHYKNTDFLAFNWSGS
jgi:hypothetical protein